MPTETTPLIPPFGENPHIDEMLHTVFVTAMEGGVQYWTHVNGYRWTADGSTEDRQGFTALLHFDDPFDDAGMLDREVNRDTIAEGFELIAQGPKEFMPEGQRHKFLAMMHARLAGLSDNAVDVDYDAGDADNLVQVALFGKVIYG